MRTEKKRRILIGSIIFLSATVSVWAQGGTGREKTNGPEPKADPKKAAPPARRNPASSTANTLAKIIVYEDQRNWNDDLKALLSDKDANTRKRAAQAAGRIGDERAVPALAELLAHDQEVSVAQEAAFALGEIESAAGADALVQALDAAATTSTRAPDMSSEVRARALEALGKIAAALPESEKEKKRAYGDAILRVLKTEAERQPDELTAMLGLTAILRARPEGAAPLLVRFLDYQDSRVVADALNTMARLRVKDGNERVRKLLNHTDPIVRANAARVIGAAEHKDAFDELLAQALNDPDLRVRASAIRALAALKDPRAIDPLFRKAQQLSSTTNLAESSAKNEILELATTLGRLAEFNPASKVELMKWLSATAESFGHAAPELEIARARVSAEDFLASCSTDRYAVRMMLTDWKAGSRLAQGLGEIASLQKLKATPLPGQAISILKAMLDYRNSGIKVNTLVAVRSEYAVSDVLQAYAAFTPSDLSEVARRHLSEPDVIVRATAAEVLGREVSEENTRALVAALPRALQDKDLNDAALAILDALGKQKNAAASDAIKTALNSDDHLIRRRAVAILKANGAGDFSNLIGLVKTRYSDADYRRAIARISKKTTATVVTSRGSFTIEFLPEDAPLTVDNFIQLAKRGFFNGQMIPRAVPNFVVQAGDPRGDQNGGPGYSIRCEVNEVPYKRAAVGMALSGKDTGGSQWFVTHSPQPHLDGGYTVFGRVIRGIEVVDNIVRGDTIRRVIVTER